MNYLFKYGLLLFDVVTILFLKKDTRNYMDFLMIFSLIIPLQLLWICKDRVIKNRLIPISFVLTLNSMVKLTYVPFFIILLICIELFNEDSKVTYLISALLVLLSIIILYKLNNITITSLFNNLEFIKELFKILPALLIAKFISILNKEVLNTKENLQNEINLRYQLKDEGEDLKKSIGEIKYLYTIKERNRISRDIHDSVGHVLSTIIIQLGAISKILETSNKEISQMASDLRDFAKNGLQDVRGVVHKLKPMDYEKIKLTDSIENMVDDFRKFSKIDVNLNINKETFKLTQLGENAVLRSIQEFLGNSAKYSKCSEINIRLHYIHDDLIITMSDDGIGCQNITPGNGILGTKERITTLGGFFEYKSSLNNGFYSRIILHKGA